MPAISQLSRCSLVISQAELCNAVRKLVELAIVVVAVMVFPFVNASALSECKDSGSKLTFQLHRGRNS